MIFKPGARDVVFGFLNPLNGAQLFGCESVQLLLLQTQNHQYPALSFIFFQEISWYCMMFTTTRSDDQHKEWILNIHNGIANSPTKLGGQQLSWCLAIQIEASAL